MLCLALEGFFLHKVLRLKHHLSKGKNLGQRQKPGWKGGKEERAYVTGLGAK